jgi:hypothetical protein
VSKADYPYPDDEFDAPPDPTAPRGVHRAPRSAWSRWWPFLAVLVIAPLLAYGIVTFASRDTSTGGDATAGTTATSTPTSTATAATSDKPSDEAEESEEPEEPADEETTPAAEVDLTTPVTVYNAAGIQGLAGAGAGELTEAGFSSVVADNFGGTAPETSTVYYATEDQVATAELVASTLGVTTVTLDPAQAGTGIAVVLVEALPS